MTAFKAAWEGYGAAKVGNPPEVPRAHIGDDAHWWLMAYDLCRTHERLALTVTPEERLQIQPWTKDAMAGWLHAQYGGDRRIPWYVSDPEGWLYGYGTARIEMARAQRAVVAAEEPKPSSGAVVVPLFADSAPYVGALAKEVTALLDERAVNWPLATVLGVLRIVEDNIIQRHRG
jgi:hypothetical protein